MSVILGARVADQVAAAVDAVRGERSRSAWLQDLIARELAQLTAPPLSSPILSRTCRHPANRRIGNNCAACGASVGKAG